MALSYIAKVFNDVDGNPSFKRHVCAVLVGLFIVVALAAHFIRAETAFLDHVLDYDRDIIKWLLGFIVAERAPQFVRPKDASLST